jgi:hypothetical protein
MLVSRGLPTASPTALLFGFRRYERVVYLPGDRSPGGQFYLPDKEFRYLRTVIVTAAVYWGLVSRLRRS